MCGISLEVGLYIWKINIGGQKYGILYYVVVKYLLYYLRKFGGRKCILNFELGEEVEK